MSKIGSKVVNVEPVLGLRVRIAHPPASVGPEYAVDVASFDGQHRGSGADRCDDVGTFG